MRTRPGNHGRRIFKRLGQLSPDVVSFTEQSGVGLAELVKPNMPAGLKFSSALVRSPVHLELAVMDRTITKVQIDQALVRNTRLFRHSFKIGHSVPV